MKTEVNPESLKGMSLVDFKKALKKDKKLLKKTKGVVFVNDYQFSDKKGMAVLFFKKPKEVKDCFKQLKRDGQPVAKMAAGTCELADGENGKELKVDIKMGGLAAEKIEQKGKSIFKTILGLMPKFEAVAEGTAPPSTEEGTSFWDHIRAQAQQAVEIVESQQSEAVDDEQSSLIQNTYEQVREFLQQYNNAEPQQQQQDREKAVEAKGFFDKMKAFVQNMPQAEESASETSDEELGGFFNQIKSQMAKVKEVVAKYKAQEVEEKDVDEVGKTVNDIKSWFDRFKTAAPSEKQANKEKAQQLKKQYPKVKGLFEKVKEYVEKAVANASAEAGGTPQDEKAQKRARLQQIMQRVEEIQQEMQLTQQEIEEAEAEENN